MLLRKSALLILCWLEDICAENMGCDISGLKSDTENQECDKLECDRIL